ncbi:MAG: hypothetical protein IKX00_02620 [Bacilli bacterium]|nr:hypothetical protein [Bacilli bacterium]
MEYNKYTGLKYIIPTIHLIMIDNNFIMREISVSAVKDLIDVFNKCSKKLGTDVEASFDRDDFDDRFIQDYELDRDEKNVVIKDLSRKRWYINHMYSPMFTVYDNILKDEDFITEARKIVDRERKRQRYEVLKQKWIDSSKRIHFLEEEIKKYKGNEKRVEYLEKELEKRKEENSINFFKQARLGYESCNHVLVETIEKGSGIKINQNPDFHRPRFEYRCIKCGLSNEVYLSGDKHFYGPLGEIMWELTDDTSEFHKLTYSEFNNAYVLSEPNVAEEIYKEMTLRYPYSALYESNLSVINDLREEVEKREKGSLRIRRAN